ncbi:glycosyltransferase [Marinicrinis sediminis]|uniref:Glycosyltransferase n=1 Tax=Marinicrinis sediminis TaxID=1652465 RepID=A0ABW5RAL1_9BACL
MKKAICILGMHRSGTSMLMRILHLLGLEIGRDEDIVSYGEDNPEGFWEHRGIVEIHEKILQEMNRGWDSIAPMQQDWLRKPSIIEYKKELVELVKKEFSDAIVWGWKDPRTCILLPLWQEIFEILDIDVSYVISLRNPLDVANSLHKRNEINKEYGIALWYYYMMNVLEYTKGCRNKPVEYDALIENTESTIKELADFIGLNYDEDRVTKIINSIKPSLRHSKSSYNELLLYTDERVASFYKNTKDMLEGNSSETYCIDSYNFYTRLFQLEKLEKRSALNEQIMTELEQLSEESKLKETELLQIKTESQSLQIKLENAKNEIKDKDIEISNIKKEISKKNEDLVRIKTEMENKQSEIAEAGEELDKVRAELETNEEEIRDAKNEILKKNMELKKIKKETNHKSEELEKIVTSIEQTYEVIDNLKGSNTNITMQYEDLLKQMNFIEETVKRALAQLINLSRTKLFKLVHLNYRIKHQVFKGDMNEKKGFFKWLLKRRNKNIYIQEHRFNPLYQIIDILEECNHFNNKKDISKYITNETDQIPKLQTIEPFSDNQIVYPSSQSVDLKGRYEKYDVILLSIINYDFRYQRPQHLANAFAQDGHRVFYFNANFHTQEQIEKSNDQFLKIFNISSDEYKNIYELNPLSSIDVYDQIERIVIEHAIRDCIVVVEYPNWVIGAKLLKEKYGFKIVTDYLDDFTGFKDTTNKQLSNNSVELLNISDSIIASSDYLAEKAGEFNNCVQIVRNGTEYEFFHKSFRRKSYAQKKKVVGYYGAVAHWFDFDKVEYLARNLSDVEIVIIGNVTEGYDRLSQHSNIKLLGEKPYKQLPKYLDSFDVCLIPFDTSTSLIKATNPVKFYEYLSAKKKVVATEIPELMPYKDKYVYLSNKNEEFLEYVSMCLEGRDSLASDIDCAEFAKENDWEHRGKLFLEYSTKAFPKVSIVVLAFNQLEYTKQCIDSILNKTAYPNYELIIVDNNSQDHTKEYLKQIEQQHSKVKVILNNSNYGFAGGNNIGLKHADGDYYILLNNDTVVTRGWITGLLKHFDNNPALGLVGPVTNSIGNEAMINTDYYSIEEMDEFAYRYTAQHMGQLYDHIKALAMYCLVIPKKVFEHIGFLDENYKVGMFEDDDYSFAALNYGYEIACAEDVFIHHFGSVSFDKLENKEYRKIFEDNKQYFEEKWKTTWVPHKYRDGIQ